MANIFPRALGWHELKKLKKATFFKISSTIFILYPLFAKAQIITSDALHLAFEKIGLPKNITIDLPFSMDVLYLSALSMFLGNIVFITCCPRLIKRYDSFNEFESSGMGKEYLFELCKEEIEKNDDLSEEHSNIRSLNPPSSSHLRSFFTRAFILSSKRKEKYAIITQVLFYAGFLLAFFVSAQNIIVSLGHVLR